MFEKVNPSHPDKVADRIAGAIVDLAYREQAEPKIAVEVLLGHGLCTVIIETSVAWMQVDDVIAIIKRIAGKSIYDYNIKIVPQDAHLASNQADTVRCGDNGIFKGVPLTDEQIILSETAQEIYRKFPTDGKYILDGQKMIICQSNADRAVLQGMFPGAIVNPLGDWTGGTDVDSGATNRKLGSDMADSVTGGGLHGKDLTKADVSVNIHAFLKAQRLGEVVELSCAIGDDTVDGLPYRNIVDEAARFIDAVGGFEKFAEWGLV